MTTTTVYNRPDGSTVELKTNPGCAPMVFLNGVLQQTGSYSLSGTNVIFNDSKPLLSDWDPWYAWRPVRINGKWYWFTKVYRRFLSSPGGGFYKYGDTFDILKDI